MEQGRDEDSSEVERYTYDREEGVLVREVRLRTGDWVESLLPATDEGIPDDDLASIYDWIWLRQTREPTRTGMRGETRVVDLFSGCGTMSLGVAEACRALGERMDPMLAMDTDEEALDVLKANFPSVDARATDVTKVLPGELGSDLTDREKRLSDEVGGVDLIVAGPPCQGSSDLNNYTRREDPKNALYSRVARAAKVFGPDHLIVENVPGIRHDTERVCQETREALESEDYAVDTFTLRAETLGVAQERHRLFLVASRERHVDIEKFVEPFRTESRDFDWACGDLDVATTTPGDGFDAASSPSEETKRRIKHLFANGIYELPDDERPPCHRDREHSYKSVYGRMRPDHPAPTITTGFTVMGQGRFVHPTCPRTITPHEAARLQFLPDYFDFGERNRTVYKKLIGNAVPTKLTYILAVQLLR